MTATQVTALYIRTTSRKDDYTLYHVEVNTAGDRHWTLKKRYSEFDSFHSELTAEVGDVPYALPAKNSWRPSSWFRSADDAAIIQERRAGLELYLRSMLSAKDAKYRSSRAFSEFLEVPRTGSLPQSEFTAASWSEELHSQLAVARQIRAEFSKRDAMLSDTATNTTTSEIRKQSVDAKIKLATLVQASAKLASGLTALGQKGMIEAEMQRRADALSRLQDEIVLLGKMATASKRPVASSPLSSNAESSSSQPASAARSDLLGPSRANKAPARVLGKPKQAQETDLTRPLDNQGLMQLQQTQMDDQDSRLDAITSVLRRQRIIAGAIHEELSQQNEMLDDLDNRVDQTSVKMKNANQKIKKLG